MNKPRLLYKHRGSIHFKTLTMSFIHPLLIFFLLIGDCESLPPLYYQIRRPLQLLRRRTRVCFRRYYPITSAYHNSHGATIRRHDPVRSYHRVPPLIDAVSPTRFCLNQPPHLHPPPSVKSPEL
ncbi:hypothetical protein HanRHA438_Chr08g0354541 [Helianthus annuus]|nr:hypothetical protein HanIR_Chr08g0370391 [Helianthus annuus]KAJ0898234.1 hypothetical protein HanRHA438_Chr08g0354541 [Helianthus annuus]